jgi:hypothetical protein
MARPRDYRLTCDICKYQWIGEPYRNDGTEEKCPECNSEEFEIGRQYSSILDFSPFEPFYIVLLIPNFLIFWS